MDVKRLEARLKHIICNNLHWQDLFQKTTGILDGPFSRLEA